MVITFAIQIDALHAINEFADTNKHAVFLFHMRRFILKMSPVRLPQMCNDRARREPESSE